MARIRVPLGPAGVAVSRLLCEAQFYAAQQSQRACIDSAEREAGRALDALRGLRLGDALDHAGASTSYRRSAIRWAEEARRCEEQLAAWPTGVRA